MKIVVGLGNPGNKYNFTRHNVGFLTLDFYFKVKGYTWAPQPKFGAIFARISARDLGTNEDIFFIKPQDFYNDTGKSVREFTKYYKIPPENILAICDNFDLEFGKIRYRSTGTASGNNGLKSLDRELGTSDYARIRIGTGNDPLRHKMGDIDFVLSRFTPEEKEQLPTILRDAAAKIDTWIHQD